MKYYLGYSYIELLLVMTTIGLMAGFGLVTYPGIQKTARDSQRRSDLKQYQTALEGYANAHGGFYPSRVSQTPASDLSVASGDPSLCDDLQMSQCPMDPRNNKNDCVSGLCNYYYKSNGSDGGGASATQFVLYSLLEKEAGYWVYCSSGSSGNVGMSETFNLGACPSGL